MAATSRRAPQATACKAARGDGTACIVLSLGDIPSQVILSKHLYSIAGPHTSGYSHACMWRMTLGCSGHLVQDRGRATLSTL